MKTYTEDPGTRLTPDQLEALRRFMGKEVQVVISGHGHERNDSEYKETREKLVLDGLLGYRTDGGYVVTHVVGHNGIPRVLCLNSWHECIEQVEDERNTPIFENEHPFFYFRTIDEKPVPEIADKLTGLHHENYVDITNRLKDGHGFLSDEFVQAFNRSSKPEDLRDRQIEALR